jgi:hypothetical protein
LGQAGRVRQAGSGRLGQAGGLTSIWAGWIYVLASTANIFYASTFNRNEVASNKSSLLLKNILQNPQTLQLFAINIKTGIIKNAKLEGLGWEI